MLIEDLRNSWVEMFNHIDDIVEKINNKYPEFSKEIDKKIIFNAVRTTQKLDKLIEDAKFASESNQERLFDDNN